MTGKFDSDVYGTALTIPKNVEVTDSDGKILSSGDKVMVGDILTIKSNADKTVTVTNAVDTNGNAVSPLAKGDSTSVIVKGAITITVR